MVRKYFVQQLGLLLMVSVIIILTNVIGYKMPVKDSIIGVLLLSAISLIGLTISKFMSRFVKLPSMMYVSLLGLLMNILWFGLVSWFPLKAIFSRKILTSADS